MTTTVVDVDRGVDGPGPREPWWARVLRGLGWTLIAAGIVVVLFIVYLLWWTDRETARAQGDLATEWQAEVLPDAEVDVGSDLRDVANLPVEQQALPDDGEGTGTAADAGPRGIDVPVDVGDAYALIWFERDGEFVVTDDIVAAVEGVTLDHLSRGPGHYPETSAPGQAGTAAFAGHRTTYGRPFHNLDLLEPGDEIHVVDRVGRHWVYDFLELEVVAPTDVWVVTDDARPDVSHLLTLTTCNPKYSAATRLVAFGQLRDAGPADPGTEGEDTTGSTDATRSLPSEPSAAVVGRGARGGVAVAR